MRNDPVPAHLSIMSLKPYVGGASSVAGREKVVKLSSNEGAFGANPAAVEACRAFAGNIFRYPDGGSAALRRAIADVHGIDADRVVCGNGSDELIGLLCHAYLRESDEVVITQYAFLMYRLYAVGCGAQPVTVPEKDYKVDVDAILKVVTPKTRMIFIANPGNPTGTYLTGGEIRRLCRFLPENIVIVLDAAYAEFVDAADYDAGISLVDEFPNVVMLRTFSKIYGLGGVRLGWSYASRDITDVLNRIRGPFNVNAFAQVAGIAAVRDRDFVKRSFEHNKKYRAMLTEELTKIGLTVTPSEANFILVHFPETGKTAEKADAFLQNRGIIVRRVASYGLPNALRMTIGNVEETAALLAAMKDFMA